MMSEKGREPEEKLDDARHREVTDELESDNETSQTMDAFNKLSGLKGTKVDEDEAVALLEERAKDRDYEAKWMLGLCCEYGMGTEQDIERAALLYRQSSEGENVVGKFLLENNTGGSEEMKVSSL